MILPQDTKEPLVDSDSELDFDIDDDDFVPPYSPAPADHAPLLPPGDGDIELCPPPYCVDSEQAWKRPSSSLRKQLQQRRTRILWSCLAIVALYTTLVTVFTVHRRPLQPRPPQSAVFSAFGAIDLGEAAGDCAVFPPGEPYPRPSPNGPDAPPQRNSNATFLLSTGAGELFDQFRRDAVVGDIFVTAYDPADEEEEDDDAIFDGDERPTVGEYVRITVQAVYDVEDADADAGPGWDMLQASDVCLLRRALERSGPAPVRSSLRSHAAGGLGVDLHATRPAGQRLPLLFHLHVRVPRQSDSAVDKVERLPPLLLHGVVGEVHASLGGAALSALRIRTSAGDIHFDEATAEEIKLQTSSGTVAGSLAVSRRLDVKTDAGNIDLDLSLAPSEDNKCTPVDVRLHSNAGNAALRHNEWAECRSLREEISTSAGNLDVTPHALFEGRFLLQTSLGNINVEDNGIPDPADDGRSRVIKKKSEGRWGKRRVKGSVAWDGKTRGKSELIAETSVGNVKVAF